MIRTNWFSTEDYKGFLTKLSLTWLKMASWLIRLILAITGRVEGVTLIQSLRSVTIHKPSWSSQNGIQAIETANTQVECSSAYLNSEQPVNAFWFDESKALNTRCELGVMNTTHSIRTETDYGATIYADVSLFPITFLPHMASCPNICVDMTSAFLGVPNYQFPTTVPNPGFYNPVGAVFDDTVYLCGGDNLATATDRCFKHIIGDNKYVEIASMNEQRTDTSAVAISGTMLVVGGTTNTSPATMLQSSEYLTQDTWTYGPELPHRLMRHCMVRISSVEVMVIGGMLTSGTPADFVYILNWTDKDTGFVKQTESLKTGRHSQACMLYMDTKVFVAGGITTIGHTSLGVTDNVEVLDLSVSNPVWTVDSPLYKPTSMAIGQALTDIMLILGGKGIGNESEGSTVFQVYVGGAWEPSMWAFEDAVFRTSTIAFND